jgi:hypothetical protein
MISLLLRPIVLFTALFAGLISAANTVGALRLPNFAITGFTRGCEDRPKTCWYGIVPGLTTMGDADSIFVRLGFIFEEKEYTDRATLVLSYSNARHNCFAQIYTDLEMTDLDRLNVSCSNTFLGDYISLFGEADLFYLPGWSFEGEKVLIHMKYSPQEKDRCLDTMPTGKIVQFTIGSKPLLVLPNLNTENTLSWHGFMPYRRYVDLYDFYSCKTLTMLPG